MSSETRFLFEKEAGPVRWERSGDFTSCYLESLKGWAEISKEIYLYDIKSLNLNYLGLVLKLIMSWGSTKGLIQGVRGIKT